MLDQIKKQRAVKDLRTATQLAHFLSREQYFVILDCGYAVDAVCKGQITRHHHDIDLIILHKTQTLENLRSLVVTDLKDDGGENRWTENATVPGWLWFVNEDPITPNSPRQLNIHFIRFEENHLPEGYLKVSSRNASKYQMSISQSHISDPAGNRYVFYTPIPEEIVATKLRLIPVYAPDWKIRDSDLHDLKLLFGFREFNMAKCVSILTSHYQAMSSIDRNKSQPPSPAFLFSKFVAEFPKILTELQVGQVKGLLGG